MFHRSANTATGQKNHQSSIFQKNEDSSAFIQPKLNVGKAGDQYEVEADKAADQIVAKGNESASSFLAPAPTVQKQADEEVQTKENENEIQQKPVVDKITPGVQLKPDPVLQKEQEEEVQQKTDEEAVQTQKEENLQESKDLTQDKKTEVTPIQSKSSEEEIQTKEDEEIQEKEEEETVQKQSTSGGEDGSGIESSLNDSKGGGSPLDSGTKSEMESGFGADFSGVRVHNDSNAVQMNQELGSQAFANGNDIYFNEGKYNPESDSGKHLLAHELTHTVQQGASPNSNSVQQSNIVQKEEAKEPAKPGEPTTVVDISKGLTLSKDWLEYIENNAKKKSFDVSVKIGTIYQGKISLKKKGKAKEGEKQKFELASKKKRYLDINGMAFLNPLKQSQIFPILVLNNFGDEQKTSGFLSVRKGADALTTNVLGVIESINKNLEAMSFVGLSPIQATKGLENKFENGGLNFKANDLAVGIDGYIQATGSMGITNSAFTFEMTSTVSVAGLAQGEFNLKKGEDGKLSGKATISADIANVNATVIVEYEKGAILIQGTGKISSEKFSGEITLLVTDEAKSRQMMHAALGVQTLEADKKAPAAPAKKVAKTPQNQVLVGWGTVEATITPWLQGKASVGIDNKGQVTIVGTITVPNDINLMDQKGHKQDLFDVEIRAGYGIPLVGQVFLFANIGMFMNAGFGPLVLKNVAFTGTYSTDPNVLQNFSITGTLGINAFAIIGLKAEAGVGVTLLGHDIKAGVALTAAAGIKAYAEATPTFEYKEQKSPQGGKVGESRLKGHFEAAAQLFLQLTGSLFYELDSPWWSPAPDGRTDYPLGEVQYPIGDSMGIGADMDWLVGSDKAPELKFSPVKFDPSKFTADVMADPPPKKMGKSDANPKGKFENKGGGGEKQKDPKAVAGGKGLPPNSKKKEDLKNLPDNQKYLRGLDELSKLEKADPKPSIGVVKAKMQKVKSKYGLQTVSIKNQKDGEVTIYVKHKKEDNGKRLLKIKLMSNAERIKLLSTAMTDLRKRETKIVDKKGKTDEAKAKDLLLGWTKAHKIIESAKVIDGKTTWDYFIDIGDKNETEKGKGKAGVKGEGVDENKLDEEGKKLVKSVLAMKEPFTNISKETHNLDFEQKGKNIELFRKSTPINVREHLEKIEAAIKKEEDKELASDVIKSLVTIKKAYSFIEKKVDEIESLFYRKDESGNKTDKKKTNFSIEMGKEIQAALKKIARALALIPEIEKGAFLTDSKQVRPPSEKVDFGSIDRTLSNGETTTDGSVMHAPLISRTAPPNTTGSQPSGKGYSKLYKKLNQSGRDVVAAHLLNHQLFGKGNDSKNTTPTPYASNTQMEQRMENEAKKAVLGENKVISYTVTVTYGGKKPVKGNKDEIGGIQEDSMIAKSISADLKELKPKEGEDKEKPNTWLNGEKKIIKTKSVPIDYETDLKITKKGKGNLIILEQLRDKLDSLLKDDPTLSWAKVIENRAVRDPLIRIGGGEKLYKKSPEFALLKKEFMEKKDKLGVKDDTSKFNSFEEYKISKRAKIKRLMDAVSTESSMSSLYDNCLNVVYISGVKEGGFSTKVKSSIASVTVNRNFIKTTNLVKFQKINGKIDTKLQKQVTDEAAQLKEEIKTKGTELFTAMLAKSKKTGDETGDFDKILKAVNELRAGVLKLKKSEDVDNITYTKSGGHKITNVEDARGFYKLLHKDFDEKKESMQSFEKTQIQQKLSQINNLLNILKSNFQDIIQLLKKEKSKIVKLPALGQIKYLTATEEAFLKEVITGSGLVMPMSKEELKVLHDLIQDLQEDAALEYGKKIINAYEIGLGEDWDSFREEIVVKSLINEYIKTYIRNSSQLKATYAKRKKKIEEKNASVNNED